MGATRAGMGCGSCKGLVGELVVEWFCGGEVEEDPSIHYYVPCIPMAKPELVKEAIRAEAQIGVLGVPRRSPTMGGRMPASKPALASLLITLWKPASTRTSATRASSTTGCTPTSRRTAPSRWCRRCLAASAPPDEPDPHRSRSRRSTTCRWSSSPADSASISSAYSKEDDCRRSGQDLDMPAGWAWGKSYRTCKSCIGIDFCRFGLGDSMGFAQKIESAIPRPRQHRPS